MKTKTRTLTDRLHRAVIFLLLTLYALGWFLSAVQEGVDQINAPSPFDG